MPSIRICDANLLFISFRKYFPYFDHASTFDDFIAQDIIFITSYLS